MPISDEIRKQALANAKERNPELWDDNPKTNPANTLNLNESKSLATDKPSKFDKQATESNFNVVLILVVSLSLLVILIILIWRKSLFKRLIMLKNLIAQKIKIEGSNRAKKAFNLLGIIWILFHLFMLLTSRDIFEYRISWNDLWLFDNFTDYYNGPAGYKSHYDITEFSIYVIIPLVMFFGKKYLNGEQLFSFKVRASIMKSNMDVQFNELKKYKELFDLGVLSEAEFIEEKRKILNK
jgi:hypothetical protein